MICEGSCDTEDWSNDAENSAAHHRNKLLFIICSYRKQSFYIGTIFHNFTGLFIINDYYYYVRIKMAKSVAFYILYVLLICIVPD